MEMICVNGLNLAWSGHLLPVVPARGTHSMDDGQGQYGLFFS